MKIEPRFSAGEVPPACVPSLLKRPRGRSPVPDRIDNGVSPAAWAAKRRRLGDTARADPPPTEGMAIRRLQETLHHLGNPTDIPPDVASLLGFCSNACAVEAIRTELQGAARDIVKRALEQQPSLTVQELNLLVASLQAAIKKSGLFEAVD